VPKKCKFLKAFINVNRLKKNVTLGNFFNSESLFPFFRGILCWVRAEDEQVTIARVRGHTKPYTKTISPGHFQR
jgi:hypothetical protein